MPTFQTFKDLSIAFKPHPVTGDVATKKDVAAIRQSVLNLLYTRRGERLFDSQLGTNLINLLFEPLSELTAGLIRDEIIDVITSYEPRVSIKSIEVSTNQSLDGFDVRIDFIVIGREDVPTNIDLFLERL